MTKHIIEEGSHDHVLSWDSNGAHCSDEECEVNKPQLAEELANIYLEEHLELARFKSGFTKPSPCYCRGCQIARKIKEGVMREETP